MALGILPVDFRKLLLEAVDRIVVRRRFLSINQAGDRQPARTGTNRHQHGATGMLFPARKTINHI